MKILKYIKFDSNLKSIWMKLERNSYATPFQSYYWMKNWYDNVGQPLFNIKLQILVITDKHKRKILLPFGILNKHYMNFLIFLGGINSDYNFPIIDKRINLDKKTFLNVWFKINNRRSRKRFKRYKR